MRRRTYKFGNSSLTLEFGDITTSDADVLVSSDDYMLTMGGGVSAAIKRAAGEAIIHDASKKIPAKLGDVLVTTAGALPAKHVFHAITIGEASEKVEPKTVIEQTTRKCLELFDTLVGLDSIAFPAIGAGSAGYSYDDVAVQMAEVIAENLNERKRSARVTIYLFDRFRRKTPIDFVSFFEEFAKKVSGFPQHEVEIDHEKADDRPKVEDDSEAGQRQQLTGRLASLGHERDKLERRLVELESGLSTDEVKAIRKRLEEISNARLKILPELHVHPKQGVAVFISYAHEDEKLRVALGKHLRALERQGLITAWHDRMIKAGMQWGGVIDENLDSAGIVMLLVSSDFINSDYCWEVEMKCAIERYKKKECLVIPVIVRPVVWKNASFADLQALPKDGKPVSTWSDPDLAFVDITESLKAAIEDFVSGCT